jgi:hypothetical protein
VTRIIAVHDGHCHNNQPFTPVCVRYILSENACSLSRLCLRYVFLFNPLCNQGTYSAFYLVAVSHIFGRNLPTFLIFRISNAVCINVDPCLCEFSTSTEYIIEMYIPLCQGCHCSDETSIMNLLLRVTDIILKGYIVRKTM